MYSGPSSYHASCQKQLEADTPDHLGLQGNRRGQRTHEHRESHCASMPGTTNIHILKMLNSLIYSKLANVTYNNITNQLNLRKIDTSDG